MIFSKKLKSHIRKVSHQPYRDRAPLMVNFCRKQCHCLQIHSYKKWTWSIKWLVIHKLYSILFTCTGILRALTFSDWESKLVSQVKKCPAMPREAEVYRLKFKVSHHQNIPAFSSNLRLNNFSINSFQYILYILGYSCLDEVQCWYLQHLYKRLSNFSVHHLKVHFFCLL